MKGQDAHSSHNCRTIVGQPVTDADESRYYSDFDCKVLDYVGRLGREDAVRSAVSRWEVLAAQH